MNFVESRDFLTKSHSSSLEPSFLSMPHRKQSNASMSSFESKDSGYGGSLASSPELSANRDFEECRGYPASILPEADAATPGSIVEPRLEEVNLSKMTSASRLDSFLSLEVEGSKGGTASDQVEWSSNNNLRAFYGDDEPIDNGSNSSTVPQSSKSNGYEIGRRTRTSPRSPKSSKSFITFDDPHSSSAPNSHHNQPGPPHRASISRPRHTSRSGCHSLPQLSPTLMSHNPDLHSAMMKLSSSLERLGRKTEKSPKVVGDDSNRRRHHRPKDEHDYPREYGFSLVGYNDGQPLSSPHHYHHLTPPSSPSYSDSALTSSSEFEIPSMTSSSQEEDDDDDEWRTWESHHPKARTPASSSPPHTSQHSTPRATTRVASGMGVDARRKMIENKVEGQERSGFDRTFTSFPRVSTPLPDRSAPASVLHDQLSKAILFASWHRQSPSSSSSITEILPLVLRQKLEALEIRV